MHSDMIDWEPAGRLPPEALTSGPDGGPNLIEIYQALKNKYRNYDTKHALRRMQTLRRGVQHLADRGFPVALEILGSINFGIVEPNSDADLIVLHYCDLHLEDGECAPSCSNLKFESDALLHHMRQQPDSENSNIEVLDCINLRYVERLIQEKRFDDAPMLFRFMFYRNMGRPVNRPLFIRMYETLENERELARKFQPWASEALAIYLKTSDHRHSFSKYNERIMSQGLDLPEELRQELKYYLEDRA
ncbi:MAG: hypothetical protein NXI24_23745 [bacterium]|nr:hypothetical protein [bacterium]